MAINPAENETCPCIVEPFIPPPQDNTQPIIASECVLKANNKAYEECNPSGENPLISEAPSYVECFKEKFAEYRKPCEAKLFSEQTTPYACNQPDKTCYDVLADGIQMCILPEE